MHASAPIQQTYTDNRLTRDGAGRKERDVRGQDTIPRRYRDGRGGINLERVRQDQRRARQQSIRAMIHWLRHWLR
ncbi:hypothetical protein [Marinobacter oulmenensis]|uniref:Uncharacterized protein n=1 Tax=Marinobacter oulmenensis TaxID=643747 RepID=A0A840UKI9_9GAMM|nr:hypothetical protein [Marinobacter oulmenensis]MBB5321616.1 hypothetical protein [Marinobacter oulmenensis]